MNQDPPSIEIPEGRTRVAHGITFNETLLAEAKVTVDNCMAVLESALISLCENEQAESGIEIKVWKHVRETAFLFEIPDDDRWPDLIAGGINMLLLDLETQIIGLLPPEGQARWKVSSLPGTPGEC